MLGLYDSTTSFSRIVKQDCITWMQSQNDRMISLHFQGKHSISW